MSTDEPTSEAKWKNLIVWSLAGVLALTFVMAGGSKLAAMDPFPRSFRVWGFPPWAMYAVGAIELGAAIGLLIPKVSGLAALVLVADMIGAAVTLARSGEIEHIGIPAIFLVLAGAVAFLRRDVVMEVFGRADKKGAAAPAAMG